MNQRKRSIPLLKKPRRSREATIDRQDLLPKVQHLSTERPVIRRNSKTYCSKSVPKRGSGTRPRTNVNKEDMILAWETYDN
jgi:hypothetical protein